MKMPHTKNRAIAKRVRHNWELFISRVALHHLLAFGYAVIAIAMSVNPQEGLMNWFWQRTGIENDFLVLLFVISAFIFVNNPNKYWFVVAHVPMALYGAIRFWNVLEVQTVAITSVIYVSANIAIPIAMRFRRIHGLSLIKIYALSMMLIGAGVLEYPTYGTAGWIARYLGPLHITPQLLGVLMIAGGLVLCAYHPPRAILFLGSAFFAYLISGGLYTFNNLGVVAGFIATELLVCHLLIIVGWDEPFSVSTETLAPQATMAVNDGT